MLQIVMALIMLMAWATEVLDFFADWLASETEVTNRMNKTKYR